MSTPIPEKRVRLTLLDKVKTMPRDTLNISTQNTKCRYCAKDIRPDAIICEFCNRRNRRPFPQRKAIVISLTSILCLIIGVAYMRHYQNRKASELKIFEQGIERKRQAETEVRTLTMSLCSEIDHVAGFLLGRHTYQENIEFYKKASSKLNSSKDLALYYLANPTNENQQLISHLIRTIDVALVITDLQLRSAQYHLDSEAGYAHVRSLRFSASNDRNFGHQWNNASYLRRAEQSEQAAYSSLQLANDKAALSSKLLTKCERTFPKFIEYIENLTPQLQALGIDRNIVFPSMKRAEENTPSDNE